MESKLRPLTVDDLAAVERIQREAYPRYHHEALAVFADKLARYPDGCWAYEASGSVVGYLFSHPCRFASPPRLDALLEEPVGEPDCYFIHDKALLPGHQGMGAGRRLLATALQCAAELGYARVALVAVQDARLYWERQGFRAVTADDTRGEVDTLGWGDPIMLVRSSYGPDAQYMTRGLG